MAVASSSQNFTVADVASAGQPADFSGLVGNYEDDAAFENQVADPAKGLTSRAGLGVVANFLFLYIMFSIAISIHERKKAGPLSGRAKKAGKRLAHAVSSATGEKAGKTPMINQ
ncbi:MAG: hypothetical protein GXP53_07735 [Deltaproteobacteria bacterium]|nr:hypothetical protein [Deltaproteobacteria bacterium]